MLLECKICEALVDAKAIASHEYQELIEVDYLAPKSVPCTSTNWHSSASHIRTKGGATGSELVRWLISLSQAAFSGSLDVQPPGLKVTTDPSMWRQVKLKFTTVHS
jgi:hypothetical protein